MKVDEKQTYMKTETCELFWSLFARSRQNWSL